MDQLPEKHLQETASWAADTFSLRIPDTVSYEMLRNRLADRLEQLISEDFQQFIFLLYRIDISEKRVQAILEENTGYPAYQAIAELIMERQLQKIASRAAFRNDQLPDDEERW